MAAPSRFYKYEQAKREPLLEPLTRQTGPDLSKSLSLSRAWLWLKETFSANRSSNPPLLSDTHSQNSCWDYKSLQDGK